MCSLEYSEFTAIQANRKNVHDCNSCPYFTTSTFLMANHVRRHRFPSKPFNCENANIEAYYCRDCDFKTELTFLFKKHITKFHSAKTKKKEKLSFETPTSFVINSVQYILRNSPIPYQQMVLIKQKDRPTPELQIKSMSTSKQRTYRRVFNRNIYDKFEWMCGCPKTDRLFCFVCLLFNKNSSAWTNGGVNDLKHLADRGKVHQSSIGHIKACMDFNILGKSDIRDQLGYTYLRNKIRHNKEVEKNCHILRRLIMCIRFCGAFELALKGHDERKPDNPGIYMGLINFAAELDSALAIHLKDAEVFKGTSKMIQNELLDAMFSVYRTELIKQIKSASFVALEVETTDATYHQQMIVVILRYVFNGQICERFWSFIKPTGHAAEDLAKTLLAELRHILSPSDNMKLISQSYEGASIVISKNNGVQAIIRKQFPCAYFIHCYSHQFYLLIEQVAQCHRDVKIFFANLQSFSIFFSGYPARISVLDEVVKKRVPGAVPTRWNFNSRTVNTLFEYKDSFIDCLEKIINTGDANTKTISEACGLLDHLRTPEFLYWLKIFHFIMPHIEVFFYQTQTSGIESLQVQNALEQFERHIVRVRSCVDQMEPIVGAEPTNKNPKTTSGDSKSAVAKEVCDNFIVQIKERFDFKDHLSAVKLFDSTKFKIYRETFPQNYFEATVKSYCMLCSVKLRSELQALYERDDMCKLDGILSLLVFLTDNGLKTVLSETYKLVDIICTTPMSTSERERCFSTSKRIKTFLRSTLSEDRLNALAVLSIEKTFLQGIPDFDNKVIDTFCGANNRRTDFVCR